MNFVKHKSLATSSLNKSPLFNLFGASSLSDLKDNYEKYRISLTLCAIDNKTRQDRLHVRACVRVNRAPSRLTPTQRTSIARTYSTSISIGSTTFPHRRVFKIIFIIFIFISVKSIYLNYTLLLLLLLFISSSLVLSKGVPKDGYWTPVAQDLGTVLKKEKKGRKRREEKRKVKKRKTEKKEKKAKKKKKGEKGKNNGGR